MRDLLTAEQVADALGITGARVRQLVVENKLPAPTGYGPKANLWQRSELEAYRVRLAAGKGRVTGQASLLADATDPLRRTRDAVFKPLANRDFHAHVRVWEGAAPEGFRRVVVVSRPVDNGYPDAFIEEIVASVDKEFLNGKGSSAVWFEAYMNPYYGHPFELSNLVMSHGRVDRRAFHRSPYSDPIWIGEDLNDLDRMTGTRVEWWPPRGYTLDSIARWQRDGGQITVVDDRYNLLKLAAAVEILRRVNPSSPEYDVVHGILRAIAPEMSFRDAAPTSDWNNGTATSDESVKWPATMAARLVPARLDEEQRDLMKNVLAGDLTADADQVLEDVRLWLQRVDEFGGPDADGNLAGALITVIATLDPELSLDPWLDGAVPRRFQIIGDTDRRFLDSLTWITGPDIDRVRRRLHRELGDRAQVTYATLPGSKVQVARMVDRDEFAIMWPAAGPWDVTEDTFFVGDLSEGDRPVYLERDGAIVGLVNLSPHHFRDWIWGYRGGVDGLAGAIIHHIRDSLPDADVDSDFVENALTHSRTIALRLHTRDLLRG